MPNLVCDPLPKTNLKRKSTPGPNHLVAAPPRTVNHPVTFLEQGLRVSGVHFLQLACRLELNRRIQYYLVEGSRPYRVYCPLHIISLPEAV